MFSIKVLIVVRGDHQRVGISRIGDLPKTFVVRRYETVNIRQKSNGPTPLSFVRKQYSLRVTLFASNTDIPFEIRSLSKPNHIYEITWS